MTLSPDTIYLKIAGFTIKLLFHKTHSDHTQKVFINMIEKTFGGFIYIPEKVKADYIIDFIEEHNFETFIRNDKITHFINFYQLNGKNKLISYYQISVYQLVVILRYILQNLLTVNKGFILHTSAANIGNKMFLFLGSPGVGKSTVIKLLKSEYQALGDDSVIIKKEKNNYYVYQTPFIEKEWWIERGSKKYLLGRIFFLRKADIFRIDKLKNKDIILKNILKQFFTSTKAQGEQQMKYIFEFVSLFQNFYKLSFRKEKKGLMKLMKERY